MLFVSSSFSILGVMEHGLAFSTSIVGWSVRLVLWSDRASFSFSILAPNGILLSRTVSNVVVKLTPSIGFPNTHHHSHERELQPSDFLDSRKRAPIEIKLFVFDLISGLTDFSIVGPFMSLAGTSLINQHQITKLGKISGSTKWQSRGRYLLGRIANGRLLKG